MKPLALDLCCGLGGWSMGLIAAGWDAVGVDVDDRFRLRYPGCRFVLGDVRACQDLDDYRTLIDLVVASPPCEMFSRHDQPWTRKNNPPSPDCSIWEACVRIAEAAEVPLILENVRGAQKWMGKAAWHVGPYYFWGDVPALMPAAALRKKESQSSSAKAERALIPIEIATYIGEVFKPTAARRPA